METELQLVCWENLSWEENIVGGTMQYMYTQVFWIPDDFSRYKGHWL